MDQSEIALGSGCILAPPSQPVYGVEFTTQDRKTLIEIRADANFYINGQKVEDPIEIVETLRSWMRDYVNSR